MGRLHAAGGRSAMNCIMVGAARVRPPARAPPAPTRLARVARSRHTCGENAEKNAEIWGALSGATRGDTMVRLGLLVGAAVVLSIADGGCGGATAPALGVDGGGDGSSSGASSSSSGGSSTSSGSTSSGGSSSSGGSASSGSSGGPPPCIPDGQTCGAIACCSGLCVQNVCCGQGQTCGPPPPPCKTDGQGCGAASECCSQQCVQGTCCGQTQTCGASCGSIGPTACDQCLSQSCCPQLQACEADSVCQHALACGIACEQKGGTGFACSQQCNLTGTQVGTNLYSCASQACPSPCYSS